MASQQDSFVLPFTFLGVHETRLTGRACVRTHVRACMGEGSVHFQLCVPVSVHTHACTHVAEGNVQLSKRGRMHCAFSMAAGDHQQQSTHPTQLSL